MKKFLSMLFLSSALVLTGCGETAETPEETTEDTTEDVAEDTASESAGELQDGTYRIEELNFGDTGWKEALEITVEGGEITDASFDSVNEEGVNKIEDEEYQEAMANVTEVGPQDFIPELESQVVGMTDPSEVEVVSGATGTSEKVQEWAQELYAAAQEGNTGTIEVDNQVEEAE